MTVAPIRQARRARVPDARRDACRPGKLSRERLRSFRAEAENVRPDDRERNLPESGAFAHRSAGWQVPRASAARHRYPAVASVPVRPGLYFAAGSSLTWIAVSCFVPPSRRPFGCGVVSRPADPASCQGRFPPQAESFGLSLERGRSRFRPGGGFSGPRKGRHGTASKPRQGERT